MEAMRWLVVAAVALVAGCGGGTYTCVVDGDCNANGKVGGQCVAVGDEHNCAFVKDGCLRWDVTAAPGRREQCVATSDMSMPMVDAGSDGGVDMSATPYTCVFDDPTNMSLFDDKCVFGN